MNFEFKKHPQLDKLTLGCYDPVSHDVTIFLKPYGKYFFIPNDTKMIQNLSYTLQHEYLHKAIYKCTRELTSEEHEEIIMLMCGEQWFDYLFRLITTKPYIDSYLRGEYHK